VHQKIASVQASGRSTTLFATSPINRSTSVQKGRSPSHPSFLSHPLPTVSNCAFRPISPPAHPTILPFFKTGFTTSLFVNQGLAIAEEPHVHHDQALIKQPSLNAQTHRAVLIKTELNAQDF
jgi:hypothetical protein